MHGEGFLEGVPSEVRRCRGSNRMLEVVGFGILSFSDEVAQQSSSDGSETRS